MAQQSINVGTTANDGTGDTLRTAFIKADANFTELFPTIRTVTATGSATAADRTILVDASSGAVTLTLPAASGASGIIMDIKATDVSGGNVIIDGNSSETIDGGLTATLTTQYESITIQCDGSEWWIL